MILTVYTSQPNDRLGVLAASERVLCQNSLAIILVRSIVAYDIGISVEIRILLRHPAETASWFDMDGSLGPDFGISFDGTPPLMHPLMEPLVGREVSRFPGGSGGDERSLGVSLWVTPMLVVPTLGLAAEWDKYQIPRSTIEIEMPSEAVIRKASQVIWKDS